MVHVYDLYCYEMSRIDKFIETDWRLLGPTGRKIWVCLLIGGKDFLFLHNENVLKSQGMVTQLSEDIKTYCIEPCKRMFYDM